MVPMPRANPVGIGRITGDRLRRAVTAGARGVEAGLGAFGMAILDMAWADRRIAGIGGKR